MDQRRKKRSTFVVEELLDSFSSENENNDKAFKFALFNGVSMLIFLASILIACSVYFILQPFVKPLIWALLCGSALHPFKLLLAEKLKTEISKLESSSKPVYLSVICMPFSVVSKLSDAIGDFLLDRWIYIVKVFGGIWLLFAIYLFTPTIVIQINYLCISVVRNFVIFVLDICNYSLVVGTVVIIYTTALIFLWNKEYENVFVISSLIVWVAVTAWFSNIFGYLRVITFVLIQLSLFVCYVYKAMFQEKKEENDGESVENHRTEEELPSEVTSDFSSSTYIRWLLLLCLGALLINVPSLPYIIVVLILIYVVKKICNSFLLFDCAKSYLSVLYTKYENWYLPRQEVLFPSALRDALTVLSELQLKFLKILKNSSDAAAAVTVILGLLFFAIFFSVFFTFQAYRESVIVVQVGGEIINKTIISNPEVHQMLPDDWQSRMDSFLNNAYVYVREGIAKVVRNILKSRGIDDINGAEIERGALELWDRAYQAWVMPMQPSSVGPIVTPDAVFSSCQNFIDRLQKTPEVMSIEWVSLLVQENMAILTSGLDSAWSILRGNMSLLLSILSTLFSLLFGGGLSLINLLINSVIFLTSLFYLLSTSSNMYKPVEIITQLSPKYGNRLALSVQNSCQEVLAASLKFSVFYGLWTWFIHTMFFSNLVYMPAVFAAILGVVPVLGTYWACVPAVIDLWVVQDSKFRAVGLLLAQLCPSLIVDTAIYNEIKGGHPYLTGLSIAGGMFWLGIEGVVVGPLLLCLLFVMLNMFSTNEATQKQ